MSSQINILTPAAVTALPLAERARRDATSRWRTQTVSTQATLAALATLLVGLTAAGEGAAQPPAAKEGPLYPALCRPGNAKLEILSPTGWTIKLPPGQTAASIQYLVKVSPGLMDPRCVEHFPHWQPAGWTVKTLFGRKGGERQELKGEFEFKDVTDVAWQASGTATLGPGEWVMLSQVMLPEVGPSKTVAFSIEQELVSEPPKTAKTDRGGPRKWARTDPEGPPGGMDPQGPPGDGKDSEQAQGPGSALSDLLSKLPGGAKDASGDPGATPGPGGDPGTPPGPGGDPKDTAGPGADPKGPKVVGPIMPGLKLTPAAKLAADPKLATKIKLKPPKKMTPHRVKVVPTRSRLVCENRRVGSHVRRVCVRR